MIKLNIFQVVKDNMCLKTIEKVKNHVKSLLPEETSTMEEESTENKPAEGIFKSLTKLMV